MKPAFLLGTFLGILLAGGAYLVRDHYTEEPVYVRKPKAAPASWLFPPDFTVAKIFQNPEIMRVLEAPESVTVYETSETGMKIGRYTFAEPGVTPSAEDSEKLRKTFLAVNSYELPSACGFSPKAAIRMKRGEHQLDLVICFGCQGFVWFFDGEPADVGFGLSDLGDDVLKSVLINLFPKNEYFK